MKSTFFSLILSASFVVPQTLSLADAPAAKSIAVADKDDPTKKKNVIWQDDPLCQFVFFAILEGLYRDGIQDEVVDLVLGETVDLDVKVKHCFVFKCELCHAAYEAFALYKARPAFKNTEGKTTFGKGAGEGVIKELKSEDTRTRVYAMGNLIRPWIQHRVKETRMTVEEQKVMAEQFREYAREGSKLLSTFKRAKDTVYINWNFYGTCQACEAAEDF